MYEDDDEEYDDEDYDSSAIEPKSKTDTEQKVIKIVKQEDLKAAVPEETTTLASTTTTTTISPTSSNRNNNVHSSRSSRIFSQNSPTQKQSTSIPNSLGKSRLTQKQNGQTKNYPSSTSSTTTSTSPTPTLRTRFLPSKHIINLQQQQNASSESQSQPEENTNSNDETPKSYVSVTKSVMGSIDNTKTPAEDKQNFESTYYTKSSTCGFFTKSCNMVYGPNGRHKVCKPIVPVNGKC